MARSLVRLVFPAFAFRIALIVLAIAVGVYGFARSYRSDVLTNQLSREAELIGSALAAQRELNEFTLRAWIRDLANTLDLQFVLFDETGLPLLTSDPSLPGTLSDGLRDARERGQGVVAPGARRRGYAAVVYPVTTEAWDAVAFLGLAAPRTSLDADLSALALWISVIIGLLLVVVLIVSYRVVERIQIPVRQLQAAAQRFADGDLEYRSSLAEPDEFQRLSETMNGMAAQLTARIEALRNQRQQLEAILGSMVEGVMLIDEQLRIQSMNPAARQLFEVERLETRRGEPRLLLDVIRNSDLYSLVRRTFDHEQPQEAQVVVYASQPRHMQVHGTSLEIGASPHVLVVLHDITRLHQLEQVRTDFVSNVSHELKTPITSILGFVETLLSGALDDRDEAERFLAIVRNHTVRLNAIIEDLLQLSRIEQMHSQLPRENVRAEEIMADVRANVQERARERNIRIEDVYEGRPMIAVAPRLLAQALGNLVDNALKYCHEGATVTVAFLCRNGDLEIRVSDDGPGIPQADQGRLFERFFRVEKARSRELGGTGLGLAIVKHIAQAHGGSVSVESTPGMGSTFRIMLPGAGSRVTVGDE